MKIALLGYDIENASAYEYLVQRYPDAQFTVYDQRQEPARELPDHVAFVGGVTDFWDVHADLLVRSPGIALSKVDITKEVTTATKLFFANCPAPIIGVTGSKGKGTTSSLIAAILRAAGYTVHLVGNIGRPALGELQSITKEDIVVYELSSFQLWDLNVSPQIAVVLHIEPDHLDVHADFEDYVNAKAHIAQYQTENNIVVYNAANEHARAIAERSAGFGLPYQAEEYAHVSDGKFWFGGQEMCSVDVLRLPGVHNQDNACAAINAVRNWVKDGKAIAAGLSAFDGLPHRLKLVATKADVEYYDDSIATTPGSAIAAMHAFDQPKIIILGGSRKGADFVELADVAQTTHVKLALLIGEEAVAIERELKRDDVPCINLGSDITMRDIVATAAEHADAGDVVILSPACASFGMFQNYTDRGQQFIDAVESLDR